MTDSSANLAQLRVDLGGAPLRELRDVDHAAGSTEPDSPQPGQRPPRFNSVHHDSKPSRLEACRCDAEKRQQIDMIEQDDVGLPSE